MNQERVELHARRLMAQWKAAPRLTVVETTADLPFPAPDDVRGAYLPSTKQSFIVAQRVAAVTAHEIIGHHGVRELFREEFGIAAWKSAMAAIAEGSDDVDARLSASRQFVRAVYRDEADEAYLSRTLEADEVVAAIAEAMIDASTGRLRSRNEFVAWWRFATGAFRREVLLQHRQVSYAEVEGILLAAEHRLRHGSLLWGLTRKWYSAAMDKPMGPAQPARSIEESERLYSEAVRHERNRSRFVRFFMGLPSTLVSLAIIGVFFGSIGLVIYSIPSSPLAHFVDPITLTIVFIVLVIAMLRR